MEITKCPHCGGVISTLELEPISRLAYTIAALLVNAAMMKAALEMSTIHQPARQGFEERLEELSAINERDTFELQDWGEAYDEDEDEEA